MKILVMGAGAMGSVFGGFLSKEHDVALVGRDPHMAAVAREGLRVLGIWGEHTFTPRAATSSEALASEAPYDLVLITTKAYDTREAVQAVLTLADKHTRFMSVQNGLGNEEALAEAVGQQRTLGCMAIFGAVLEAPGRVRVTVCASSCRVGVLQGKPAEARVYAALLNGAGIPTEPTEDILQEKWMKAFYNIALNPLSALLRVPYGRLGEEESTRRVMKSLLEEAFRVAGATGIGLQESLEAYWRRFLNQQIPSTAQHTSSMLQDIQRGRRTEIDFLNGAIVRMGAEVGAPTPVNAAITNLVYALETWGGGGP